MARSATFSVVNATAHSSIHNSRQDIPKYLIGILRGQKNEYLLQYSDDEFIEKAKIKYKEVTGQKMQQKQIDALIKETVFSLEDHHTADNVENVFKNLAEKYGGHFITELSIHRDEGYFMDDYEITYYPTIDILKKEDGWYIVPLIESISHAPAYKPKYEEFSEKVDITKYKTIYNIHAHIKFSMFDLKTGKTGRMKHYELNDRIKTAAKILKLDYIPENKKNKRLPVAEIKVQHKAVRNEKVRNFLEYSCRLGLNQQLLVELHNNLSEAQSRIFYMENFSAIDQSLKINEINNQIIDKDKIIALLEAKLADVIAILDKSLLPQGIEKSSIDVKIDPVTMSESKKKYASFQDAEEYAAVLEKKAEASVIQAQDELRDLKKNSEQKNNEYENTIDKYINEIDLLRKKISDQDNSNAEKKLKFEPKRNSDLLNENGDLKQKIHDLEEESGNYEKEYNYFKIKSNYYEEDNNFLLEELGTIDGMLLSGVPRMQIIEDREKKYRDYNEVYSSAKNQQINDVHLFNRDNEEPDANLFVSKIKW